EAIDPVRFIGNRSSGKMGYAVAEAAKRRGAKVIVISAPTALAAPAGCEVVPVVTAEEMRAAVMKHLPEATMVVMAAAVSDYRVAKVAAQKLKRNGARTLELEPTEDILSEIVAQRRAGTLVIGFAAETEDVLANGREKLRRKGVDAIVVNDVSSCETGFDSDRNAGGLLTRDNAVEIPAMSKTAMAERILDEVAKLRAGAGSQSR
ncbi:MAG: coaBC, partial [Edaphobacter sp.]|nr:coaBC [Edaphobacter sp.]